MIFFSRTGGCATEVVGSVADCGDATGKSDCGDGNGVELDESILIAAKLSDWDVVKEVEGKWSFARFLITIDGLFVRVPVGVGSCLRSVAPAPTSVTVDGGGWDRRGERDRERERERDSERRCARS